MVIVNATDILAPITSAIANNIGGVLIVFATIVGLAIVAALIDWATGANYTTWRSPSTGRSYKIRKY